MSTIKIKINLADTRKKIYKNIITDRGIDP